MSNKLGFEAKMYIVGGTDGSPTFTEITGLSEVSIDPTRAELDADTRDSLLVDTEQGKMSIAITGKIIANPEKIGYEELENSFFGRGSAAKIRVMCLDAPMDENGAFGYAFDCKNYSWAESQGLNEVIYRSFNLKPCPSTWKKRVNVTGGSPVLTDI